MIADVASIDTVSCWMVQVFWLPSLFAVAIGTGDELIEVCTSYGICGTEPDIVFAMCTFGFDFCTL